MILRFIDDIQQSLKNHCYFSALALALTLPDICGMAEYPDKSVSERYITWYDVNLKSIYPRYRNEPLLTGEIVYNLRNCFLHQGRPNIDSKKIKDEENRINKFILWLGDATIIYSLTVDLNLEDEDYKYKAMVINVSHLCNHICDGARTYYENNSEKFHDDFIVLSQEEIFKSGEVNPQRGKAFGSLAAYLMQQGLEEYAKERNLKITGVSQPVLEEVVMEWEDENSQPHREILYNNADISNEQKVETT